MITGALGIASPVWSGTKVDSDPSLLERSSCVKWGCPFLSRTIDTVDTREIGFEGIGAEQKEKSGVRKEQPLGKFIIPIKDRKSNPFSQRLP